MPTYNLLLSVETDTAELSVRNAVVKRHVGVYVNFNILDSLCYSLLGLISVSGIEPQPIGKFRRHVI